MPVRSDVVIGSNVIIISHGLSNIYGCAIGNSTKIGPFVEIQNQVTIGNFCKISSHSFICEGVVIEDYVMIGHGVMFTNDRYPRSTNTAGELCSRDDWTLEPCRVERGASIGSNATILPGVTIGCHALIGAGAVVTRDVPAFAIAAGVPATVVGDVREQPKIEPAHATSTTMLPGCLAHD